MALEMTHVGTQTITTSRLTLRPFVLQDAPAMYENWASDPEVTKYLTWPTHDTVYVSENVLRDWVGSYADKAYYQWAIVPNEDGDRPVGSIAVVKRDDAVGMLEIGYCIGRGWWGRGITPEALGGVIDYLFTQVGANRIQARHDPRNAGSGKVMLKCGMRYEGTHRQADRNNQGLCDSAVYAILAED